MPATPTKVLITHAYSLENKGDAALLAVLIAEVRRVLSGAEVTVLTLDETAPNETFDDAPMIASFMSHSRYRYKSLPVRMAYGIAMMAATMTWAGVYRRTGRRLWLPDHLRRLCDLYADADVIVPVGGGYLRGWPQVSSIYNVVLLTHPLFFAARLGKPTILFSQSLGPFGWRVEEWLVRRAITRAVDLVLVREDKSMALLERLGVAAKAVRSVDAGFLLTADEPVGIRARIGVPAEQTLLGITVRKWLLDPTGQDAYEQAVAEVADHAIAVLGMAVVFIPQVTSETHDDDDREASLAVQRLMVHGDRAHVLMDKFGHREIKAVYAELDLLLGTRFHSVIFALTASVPALAIEYEHKTSGILKDLELEQWCLPIDSVRGSELIAKLTDLVAEREKYVAKLEQNLPAYIAEARQATELTAAAYRKHDLGATS